jgi:hypothetical protein
MDDSISMDEESNVVTFKEREAIEQNQSNASGGDASNVGSVEHTMSRLLSEFKSETMHYFDKLSARVEKQMHEMKRDIENLQERMRESSYDSMHR